MSEKPAPWDPGDSPEERVARREAHERLAAAADRVGMSLRQLHALLSAVAYNEAATRRFLVEEVYDVPDSLLDDLLRVRLADLEGE